MAALQQLALLEPQTPVIPGMPVAPHRVDRREDTHLCAGCRAKEARYGFRDARRRENSRTLCFECFRMELDRRHAVAEQLAKGWNASQPALPLAQVLEDATRRRRRAQIAARHALGIR